MDAAILKDVAANIAGYFRDFIESDFKKIQMPSRRIVLQTDSGFRAGMRLKPYELLARDVWKLIQQPSGDPMQLRITPRKYTRALSPVLRKVIEEQIGVIDPQQLAGTRAALMETIDKTYAQAIIDPEEWVDRAIEALCDEISTRIVKPLIGRLDGPLQRQAYSVIDSLYAAETDMVSAVAAELAGKLPDVLARHLAKRNDEAVLGALDTFLTIQHTKDALGRFFDGFVTADAFLEFRDLETYASITDGVTLYLYIGALRFRSVSYPLPDSEKKLGA
ncbi:hypothetical protein WJ47_12460 [Burkholderia ubonensis]|uniref:Uncharacterized protein n=1 Tax=Burkholderia ubonensis TaxID=101571 RepID=A0AB73FRE5_9BURK|nr:hypothetical protein [Burkholderia ubonensis]KVK87633.1 hypothetical protein WJ44_32930 [Burkholderia ubonensis]KVL66161.1 hypothetical protein WJ47_12460 [Burkholderia ubonensis]KVM19896.1 hypothetical protein WJ53_22530 [Burkholderia ubonensis]KVM26781.1 hypothetical protein WJ54_16145 [Burkholderia ubonensis]